MQVNQSAPVFQTKEIFIQASPEKVWAILTHVAEWPRWNSKITKAKLEGNASEGTPFRWTINGAGIQSVFHTVKQPQALGWSGVTFGATAIHNWYLQAHADGTRVKVEESMEGWLISLFRKKMNRDLASDMLYWLEALKQESEK
jgi:uncharacterized protein YndB with AHSA1/START domain